MINLEHSWREDWKHFLAKDEAKAHWIKQRILEDENQWLVEAEQPPIPKYIPEKKIKLSPVETIKRGYAMMLP